MSTVSIIRGFFTGASNVLPFVRGNIVPPDTSPAPIEKNFEADGRIYKAEKGIAGVYRLSIAEREKIIFEVISFTDKKTDRTFFRIYPLTYYKDGAFYGSARRKGNRPYFHLGVFSPQFSLDRIPEKYRADLVFWAELFARGVKKYNDKRMLIRENRIT